MPTGDLLCIIHYLFVSFTGETEAHTCYKRVSSGREGIALRDQIVSAGDGVDDRVFVTDCKFVALTGRLSQEAASFIRAAA